MAHSEETTEMRTHPGFRAFRSGAALLLLIPCLADAQEPAKAPEVQHVYVDYTLASPAKVQPFEKVDPKAAGIDPVALDRLVKRAEETHSDALVILQDGKLVGDWRFGKPAGPIETMSVTKSVVNLAIGRLVTTGKLKIDEPVATFYPQWKGTPKEKITVRHLLDHTSGLQANPSAQEVYASRDIVKLALDAPLATPPGATFFYNNKAVNLLGGIVEKVAGKKLDEYLRDEVFAPLGVARFSWMRDPAGNPHVLAGVQLDPLDLAKIGQLMLGEGTFQGKQLLTADWVRESVRKGAGAAKNGLLWWPLAAWTKTEVTDEVLDAWRKGGADPAFVEKMAALRGKPITSEADFLPLLDGVFGAGKGVQAYVTNVRAKGLPGPKGTSGPIVGFNGNGYLGQFVAVLPASRLVVVRMIRQESFKSEADGFGDFYTRIQELVPAGGGTK
jgi:CubicO group peptidase (beta-lactamase class C family)